MQFKQNQQERAVIFAALEKSILPAVLAAVPSNGQYVSGWLLKNCMDANGLVDASVDNLRRACSALHTAGLLTWTVSPNQKQVRNDARSENTDQTGLRSETNLITEAVKKYDDGVEKAALVECETLIAAHRSYPHSKTYREREQLQAEFQKLLAIKTKPTQIKSALLAKQQSFPAK